MALSTKFVLNTQSTLNTTEFPIMPQVIIDRKNQLVSTKKHCGIEQWQSKAQSVVKSHPKHREINLLLRTINSEIDFFVLSEGKKGVRPSFDQIKEIVRKLTGGNTEPESTKLFPLFEAQIKSLKEQERIGYAETFRATLNSLRIFMKEKDRDLTAIGLSFLQKYEDFLMDRGCAITTRSVYFRTFRTLWKKCY